MPVFGIVAFAYSFVFRNIGVAAKVLGFPAIALTVLWTLMDFGILPASGSMNAGQGFVVAFAAFWWHRYFLLGETYIFRPEAGGKLPIGRFILTAIGIGFLTTMVLLAATLIALPMYLGIGQGGLDNLTLERLSKIAIAVFFFSALPLLPIARMMVVFPAAALGLDEFRIGDAWRATKGQSFRTGLIILYSVLPLLLLQVAFMFLTLDITDTTAPNILPIVAVNFTSAILNVIGTAVLATALSAIFVALTEWEPEAA